MAGDCGAAGTVTSSKDERHNTLCAGFSFVVWTEEVSSLEISPTCSLLLVKVHITRSKHKHPGSIR